MPTELEYIEKPVTVSFQPQGGQFPGKGQYPRDKYHGLSIVVPPQAVSEDQEVKLQIGVCCCGPFSIREQYQIASDFYVIVADGKFSMPVKVLMDHCLLLPEYKKCSEVFILKANHQKANGLYTFDQFTYPEVSPDSPELSFEINKFCILCSVLDEGRVRTSSMGSTTSLSQAHIDDSNPSSAQSSFDEALGVERSHSEEGNPPYRRVLSTSSESGLDSPGGSPQRENLRKRKVDSLEGEVPAPPIASSKSIKSTAMMKKRHAHLQCRISGTAGKRRCAVEYTALLFQSKEKVIDVENQNYRFVLFICTNCGAAQKVN